MALLHCDFFSDVLGMCVEADVILPENTAGQIGMEGTASSNGWKTLYLLHGMSDDHTIWQRRTSIERYAADKNLAVVMPSTQLGWYTDMKMGPKWFTYISEELINTCRSFFPGMSKRREDTFVAGLSMGGYGALKCGLCAPETFSWAASLSGAVDMRQYYLHNDLGSLASMQYWLDIFGTQEEFFGSVNDLYAQAEKTFLKPHIYMWCGQQDSLLKQNRIMKERLEALGYDLSYHESAGDHQWKYWDEHIQNVLDWLPLKEENHG